MGQNRLLTRCHRAVTVSERLLVITLLSIAPLLAQNAELSGLITEKQGQRIQAALATLH